jgi:hypothetical protein
MPDDGVVQRRDDHHDEHHRPVAVSHDEHARRSELWRNPLRLVL